MSEICVKVQTRGRPRKNVDQKLPPISRKLFSQHCAVFYACCMVYVLEVFLKTKQQKRIGHSQGGFTLYEKLNQVYCFQTLQEDLKQWGFFQIIMQHESLWQFVKTVNGCAPKFVFREIVTLFVAIYSLIQQSNAQTIQELDLSRSAILNASETELGKTFRYIRFSSMALRQLKIQKWGVQVNKKIKSLWRPFLKVVSYTILCVVRGQEKNKYLKPFFSDAQHPEETIIGQLNLQQIVEEREQKIANPGFIKISKLEEQYQDPPRRMDYDQSPSFSERISAPNLRPITLITFPSSTKIQNNSPSKLFFNKKNSFEEQDEEDILSHKDPSKKVKKE